MNGPFNKMPYIKLKGSPQEIGFQHGSLLKERIHACYEFYTSKLMVNPLVDLEEYGERFLEVIRKHFPHYATEIEYLAKGAEMAPWQIAVLNARTELFIKSMAHFVNECTTCFFRSEGLLGENWDWMLECEELVALLEIEREDGHKILMVAEPGIIGKIGLNSAGIGVGLNILHGTEFEVAVPVHILLRAALDSRTIDEAQSVLKEMPICTFSNVMVSDEFGNYLDYEFQGRERWLINYGNRNPIHTNHYLWQEKDEPGNPMYSSSLLRMSRAHLLNNKIPGESLEKMKAILLDQENGKEAICVDFHKQLHFKVGTVSSMIMDLPQRKMWVTKGSPLRNDYQVYSLI